MAESLIQYSFAAGELSPTLYGRVELAKYRIGAAVMKNYFVDYRGGASTRAGTSYIGTCKTTGRKRLIPFQFNADINQNYALEFGHNYMRVIQNGGYVLDGANNIYEISTPYSAGHLAELKFTQSNDKMTLTHPLYRPRELTRTDHDAWTLTTINFGSTISRPGGVTVTGSGSGTASFSYTVTAVALNGDESRAAGRGTVSSTKNITAVEGANTVVWNAKEGVSYYNVFRAVPAVDSASIPRGAAMGYIGRSYSPKFVDSNIVPDFTRTPPLHFNPFVNSAIEEIRVLTGGSGYTGNPSLSVTDPNGSGFSGYVVTNSSNEVVAIVIREGGSGYTNPSVTVGTGTGATFQVFLTPASGNYPSVSTYYQQRHVFAATLNKPQTLWGSRPGRYKNFDVSVPVVDNDSYEFTLDANQSNAIKHMVPMPGGLVILTASGAWQLNGGQQNAAVTPSNAQANPQAYNGCNDLRPITINTDLLYVQTKGTVVRSLAYNIFANVYTGTDMSILSNHLFKDYEIVDWAYAEEPFKLIWAVRNDGVLLSFTYLKDQDVYAWARHTTKGLVKNICAIQENAEDVLYLIVSRLINGAWIDYVERMTTRSFINVEDAWCVDCGLDYPLTYPASGLTMDSVSGEVTFTRSSGTFTFGANGATIRVNGGVANIPGPVTAQASVTGIWVSPPTKILFEDADQTPLPVVSGEWSATENVTVVSGLGHLEGQLVAILADGNVQTRQVVTGGQITLQHPASRIIIGLPFRAELRTLPLDAGEPTIQGKKKRVYSLAMKVNETRGLRVGPSLAKLTEVKERTTELMGQPTTLQSGEQSILIHPQWDDTGQVWVVQDNPLPATVLALVPDVRVEAVSR